MVRILAVLLILAIGACGANLEWERKFAARGRVQIVALGTDHAGNVYVAGNSDAFDLPVKNAFQSRNPGTPVIVSDDSGRSWRPLGVMDDQPYPGVRVPAIHPRDSNLLISSGVFGIYRSTDAGQTWRTVLDLHSPTERTRIGYIDEVQFDPIDGSTVYAAASGGVLKSTDAGQTWALLTQGLSRGFCCLGAGISVDPFRHTRVVYSINDRAYVSNDSGATWIQLPGIFLRPLVHFNPLQPNIWYIEDYTDLYRSMDGGATWLPLGLPPKSFPRLFFDPATPGRLYAIAAGKLSRSDDSGSTWTDVGLPATKSGTVVARTIAIQPGNSNRLLMFGQTSTDVSAANIAAASDDAGASWNMLGIHRPIEQLRFDVLRPSRLYAAGTPTSDVFVAKVTPAGETEYLTYLGGQGADTTTALTVDQAGNVYVAGRSESADFNGATSQFQPGVAPSLFVAELDPSGKPVFITLFGNVGYSLLAGLALGPDASVYATGFDGGGAFVLRFAADGSRIVNSMLLGPGTDARSIAVDSDGGLVVSGRFLDPAVGAAANLAKFDADWNFVASQNLPVTIAKVAVDSEKNIYVTGTASVRDLPMTTEGVFQTAIDTNCPHDSGYMGRLSQRAAYMTDAYIAKYNADLSQLQFATFLGGSCVDFPTDLRVDSDGGMWVTGSTMSQSFPVADPVFGPPAPGWSAPFIAHLDASGSAVNFSTFLPFAKDRYDVAFTTAAAPNGAVYVSQTLDQTPSLSLYFSWLLKITPPAEHTWTLQAVVDGFSMSAGPISPQEIVSLDIPDLVPSEPANLGFTPGSALPTEFSGVRVEFNGVPAPLMAVQPGQIVAIAPASIADSAFASIRVRLGEQSSNVLSVPVNKRALAFLPQVRNEDGTLNSADNPAPRGSMVSLFFTGAGLPDSGLVPVGSVVGSIVPTVTLPLDIVWDGPKRYPLPRLQGIPGFVAGLYEVRARVPVTAPPGADRVALSPSLDSIEYPDWLTRLLFIAVYVE